MATRDYQSFIDALIASLQPDDRVLGLVALGSMATPGRADAYSDYDFFVVTRPGQQDTFRQQQSWLPNHDNIALAYRETEHGLKVLFNAGRLAEYAVFDPDELNVARANDYKILFDKADIAARMAQRHDATAREAAEKRESQSDAFHFAQLICLLYVGCGRYARGENLSGRQFVTGHALTHFVTLCERLIPTSQADELDNLDPYRRFERAYPEIGAALNALLLTPVPDAAITILDLAERRFAMSLPDYPAEAVKTLRAYIQALIPTS